MNLFISGLKLETFFVPITRTSGLTLQTIFVQSIIKFQDEFISFIDEIMIEFESFAKR